MKSLSEKIQEKIPTLVVFENVGDGNSSHLKHLVDDLRKAYANKAAIIKVDASFDGNVKENFKLKEYPTWILYKEGEELMREAGNKTLARLTEMLDTAL